MSKIVVVENLSLDGVMQAPGRADEDVRGGFAHGGWAMPYNDAVKFQIMAGGMAEAGPMLFGRRTYEDFYKVWPNRTDNPFTAVLDNAQKYVASTTLTEPLPWENSTLLTGDVAEAVARLKEQPGKDIVVLGSGELVRSLMPARPRRRVRAADPPAGAGLGPSSVRRRRRLRRAAAGRREADDHGCDDRHLPPGRTGVCHGVIDASRNVQEITK